MWKKKSTSYLFENQRINFIILKLNPIFYFYYLSYVRFWNNRPFLGKTLLSKAFVSSAKNTDSRQKKDKNENFMKIECFSIYFFLWFRLFFGDFTCERVYRFSPLTTTADSVAKSCGWRADRGDEWYRESSLLRGKIDR